MSHPETLGFAPCPSCKGQAAWKTNRSGLAYCRCDHCGVETRHHWQRTSDKLVATFAAPAAPEPKTAEADKPAAPQPAPAAKKQAAAKPSVLSTLLG